MISRKIFITLFIVIAPLFICAQQKESLRGNIEKIVAGKKAKVGVSIIGPGGKDTLSVNGGSRFPMQSVFKFHIGLTVMSLVDKGKLSLSQTVKIDESELLPGLYSPLREKYPNGATLPLSEIVEYTVSKSDNVGCDVLLKLIGGPPVVERYFHKAGFTDISIKINEEVMQNNWDLQFSNWITPRMSSEILAAFYYNRRKQLSKPQYDFIWKTMRQTETGADRLRGLLPEGTVVAHKTGWSGANRDGVTAAVNDVGVVFLPDGRHFFISVFVTESREDLATNERVIAEVARAAWDFFVGQTISD